MTAIDKDKNQISNGVDRSKLLMASIASIVAAVVANIILLFIVRAVFELPDGFLPLTVGPVTFFTILGTGAGALVFWWLNRRSATPARTYWIVATVALILSIIPNFLSAANPSTFPIPGGTSTAFLVLILFHVVAMVVSVVVLLRLSTAAYND